MYEGDWSISMLNYFCMHLNCWLASLCYLSKVFYFLASKLACESSASVGM
jgi:hypothetical protein